MIVNVKKLMQNKNEKGVKLINKETQKAFESFQERIKEASQIQTEPFKAIQKQFEAIFAPIKAAQEKMNATFEPIQKEMKRIQKSFQEVADRFSILWQSYPEDLITIGQYGWYLGMDATFGNPNYIAGLCKSGKVKEVDEYLANYFDDHFKYHFKKLYITYPNRKSIFDEMYKLYIDKSYYGFINLALAQVDGICFDVTRQKFFLKNRDNNHYPQVYSELVILNNSFIEAFLAPLKNNTPILARECDLHQYHCQLNRHKILHGVDTEYGGKVNALKVFSLLVFIFDLLEFLKKD